MSFDRLFHVYTIANRPGDYQAMRASFAAGGFDDASTAFTLLDNSEKNQFDPYRVAAQIVKDTPERYIILCHQDIRLLEGQTRARLTEVLRELDAKDQNWMVAGNAGFDPGGEPVLHVDDPGGSGRHACLPQQVSSLDENFLVLKARSGLKSSDELKGFHLYGTDLCLNAYKARGSAYVIDFVVQHLSGGNPYSLEYKNSVDDFEKHWRKQLTLGLVRTTCTQMLLSSNATFESLLPKYGTIAQFFWDIRKTLIFHPVRFPNLVTLLFAVTSIPTSLIWRFTLRRFLCKRV